MSRFGFFVTADFSHVFFTTLKTLGFHLRQSVTLVDTTSRDQISVCMFLI